MPNELGYVQWVPDGVNMTALAQKVFWSPSAYWMVLNPISTHNNRVLSKLCLIIHHIFLKFSREENENWCLNILANLHLLSISWRIHFELPQSTFATTGVNDYIQFAWGRQCCLLKTRKKSTGSQDSHVWVSLRCLISLGIICLTISFATSFPKAVLQMITFLVLSVGNNPLFSPPLPLSP